MAQIDQTRAKLKEIYYNPEDPGSYGGVDRLYKRVKELGVDGVKRADVQSFLRDQRAYTLHKPSRKNYRRNPTLVKGIDTQWQADLADMQGLSHQNGGIKFLLTVIDVFSKFAWVIPLKDKSGRVMLEAFKKLFTQSAPRKPERLHTDKGKEFLNRDVKNFMASQGIELFQTFSDKKAAVVERFNRTLKTRIWTYFSAQNTKRYIDVLPRIVQSYNHSHHRSIGMAPADVKKKDEDSIWQRLYGDAKPRALKVEMAPGQTVRLSKVKTTFEKGYMPNWTEQHFTVEGTSAPKRRIYKLQNIRGDPINGTFYQEEIQPIGKTEHLVEKIIKRRQTPEGTSEIFVKWKGWPDQFNTWIPSDATGKPVPGHSPQ